MCSSTLALQQTNKHSAGHTNKQTRLHRVGYVLLHFCNVVRHIIDNVHVQVIRGRVEGFSKGLQQNKQTNKQ